MKKKIITFLLLIGISAFTFVMSYCLYFFSDNKRQYLKDSNMLSIYLETEENSGEYKVSEDDIFLKERYAFNKIKSKCENGGKLSYNSQTGQVSVATTTTDRCFVYFDKEGPRYNETCDDDTLACLVAKKYEIDPSMYYHNITLESGAGDKSYRFAGGDYILSEKTKDTYSKVLSDTVNENGLVKFYCSSGANDSYVGNPCYNSNTTYTWYYYLANNPTVHFSSFNEAINEALKLDLIEPIINNYVCFGSNDSTCPDDNLYRIIGVFDEDKDGIYNVKLIKADFSTNQLLGEGTDYNGLDKKKYASYKGILKNNTIGLYYWNYSGGYNRSTNRWNESNLNKNNLNSYYINKIGSTWSSMIDTTTWKTGGIPWEITGGENASSVVFNYEVGINSDKTKTYSSKIGLMYISDFLFSSNPNNWYLARMSGQTNDNWLQMGLDEWTISRESDSTNVSHGIWYSGALGSKSVYMTSSVRPSFYLLSSIKRTGGTGTKTDPYRLSV